MLLSLLLVKSSISAQSLATSINIRVTPSILQAKYEKSPPFLVNNSQFLLNNTLSLRFLYKRMIFGVGINYQSQKIRQNCIFIPGPNDPYPSRSPFISETLCTHVARGSHKLLDFPILLGINIFKQKNYNIYVLGTFSPISKYWNEVSFIEKATSEGFTLRSQQTNFLKYTPISFSLGLSYQLTDKILLHTEPTLYADSFHFETYLIGIGLGASWKL